MKMSKENRKRLLTIVAAFMSLVMACSTFAFFTDNVTIRGETRAGTLKLNCDKTSVDLENTVFDVDNFNPGDIRNVNYTLSSAGNKAMYINDTVTLTIALDDTYAKDVSFDNIASSQITMKQNVGGLSINTEESFYDDDTKTFTLVYKSPQVIVSGVGENAEIISGYKANNINRNYTLNFDNTASNIWQNCKTTVTVDVSAIQYANVDATNTLPTKVLVDHSTTSKLTYSTNDSSVLGSESDQYVLMSNFASTADSYDIVNNDVITPVGTATITGIKDDSITDLKMADYYEVDGKYYKITDIQQGSSTHGTIATSNLSSVELNKIMTKIPSYAFYGSPMSSFVINDNVNFIGTGAFENCKNLSSVFIPNSVEQISNYTFAGSGLTSVTIPGNIKYVDKNAFSNCKSLTDVTIENGVETIGQDAFYYCENLRTVNIPKSVSQLGYVNDNTTDEHSVFHECLNLTSINVDANNSNYSSVDGVLYSKDKNTLFACPCGKIGDFSIPDYVSNVVKSAFYGCSKLESVDIPNSVTKIDCYVFYGCSNLASVNIPDSVTSIGEGAFIDCSKLTSIMIPNSVKTIDKKVFYNCSGLTSIDIPNSVTTINDFAFGECNQLSSINLPSGITEIKTGMFSECSSLTSITIPDNVTKIDNNAFFKCYSLADINIPDTVSFIGKDVFYLTKWLSNQRNTSPDGLIYVKNTLIDGANASGDVVVKDGVTSIANECFVSNKNITSVSLPNTISSIGEKAFYSCSKLTTVNIPNTVSSLESYTFGFCYSLNSINFPASITKIGAYTFYDVPKSLSIVVENDSVKELLINSKYTGNIVVDATQF